ncbi:MAG: hypothetical protein HQK65_15990 [Desulfamplus sp.]|nr:hypothetical protein [Desulfamplus sp.]
MSDENQQDSCKDGGNEVTVTILMKSGREVQGRVNILGCKRFSDFIDEDRSSHVKMYNAIETGQIKGARPRFILIPKNSIDWYIPLDSK